ncbi:hypothetical protein ONZ45_g13722 [Pleurotus djamor]|nr:hypothetical protein ONZ45_g13722 [Pleurotus djamor]
MFPSSPVLDALSGPFKRAQFGLFQGKSKQYGNNVPFSKHKTRRTWLPNVQQKYLFSETLGQEVRLKMTTRALKTIKKYGGLDNYVLNTRADLLAWEGMRVRLLVQQRLAEKRLEGRQTVEAASPSASSTSQPPAESQTTAESVEASESELPALELKKTESLDSVTLETALAGEEPTERLILESLPEQYLDMATTTTTPSPSTTAAPLETSPKKQKRKHSSKHITMAERLKTQLSHATENAQREHEEFLLGRRPTLEDARRVRLEAQRVVTKSDALTTIAYLQSKEAKRQPRA